MEDLIQRAWRGYKVLSNTPEELRQVCNETLLMMGALRLIDERTEDNPLSSLDKRKLRELMTGCSNVLSDLENALVKLRTQELAISGFSPIRDKILVQTTRLSSFQELLRSHTQEKILDVLEQMREIKDGQFQRSLLADRPALEENLQELGISEDHIDQEFFFIEEWLKETYPEDRAQREESQTNNFAQRNSSEIAQQPAENFSPSHSDEPTNQSLPVMAGPSRVEPLMISDIEEELPDYSPGAQRGTIAEKVQSLEQSAAIMSMSPPAEAMGSGSKASPPPYTFDEGNDQEMDEEFSRYMRKAVEHEVSQRLLARIQTPESCPQPYSWLPKHLQTQYHLRGDIVKMIDEKSFTAMAYETVPRCYEEIERLASFLQMSSDKKPGQSTEKIIREASQALKTFAAALAKFTAIQDQRLKADHFSDLDVLDFEYSTAPTVEDQMPFPHREFELAQKTHYLVLTYIMGLLGVLSDLFPGRTYITRTPETLVQLWTEKKMTARTAWVEKQLAGWDQIDAAVLTCRDWHRLRPKLRERALSTLKDWTKSQKILAENDGHDMIELTVIGASGLPRSRLGVPNIFVKLVVYIASPYSTTHGLLRSWDESSDTIKSQNPVWDRKFRFRSPKNPRMVHIELHERIMGVEKEISRVKLKYSCVPGVEQSFAERSLIYGLDEALQYNLEIPESKGKEKEAPVLRIGLKWQGRMVRVEEAGLPRNAPGKMFRQDLIGIPMPADE